MRDVDLANVYRFDSGKFEGLTIEQALLQNPADMYDLFRSEMRKYERYPFTRDQFEPQAREFIRLWMSLCYAEAIWKCSESKCERVATSATFATIDLRLRFWCKQHPRKTHLDSPKMLISMDNLRQFRTKRVRRFFAKEFRRALDIPTGTRITERFAQKWFRDRTKTSPDLLRDW
jgi:hypothetical protein